MLVGEFVARLDERADCRRCGVEDGDAVLLNHFPEAPEVRFVRCALIHHLGDTVGQRAVDDVGVAGDPADIGGAPIDILIAHVEDVFAGGIGAGEVTAGGVQDALGLPGGARGVEDEKRVLGIETFRLVLCGGVPGFLMPPMVPPRLHGNVIAGALDDEDVRDLAVFLQRLVHDGLEGDNFPAPPSAVRRDDRGGSGVLKPVEDGLGGETAEYDIVHRANAGAGEHRDGGLRDHRHVDQDAILRFHPARQQDVGELADLAVELGIGDGAGIARLSLPDDRSLVRARPEGVAVHAVFGDVKLPADKPLRVRGLPFQDLGKRLLPGEFVRLGRPEFLGLFDGMFVKLFVFGHGADAGFLGKFLRRLVDCGQFGSVVACGLLGFLGAHGFGLREI